MFMNKEKFIKIGGWDKNIFLFFEETEFCYRGKKKKLFSYQINSIITKTVDTTVKIKDKKIRQNWQSLLRWHFIWSKFYVYKKKYGFTFAIILFLPTIARIFFKLFFYSIFFNEDMQRKYRYRLNGLYHSIIGNKSFLRLNHIKN